MSMTAEDELAYLKAPLNSDELIKAMCNEEGIPAEYISGIGKHIRARERLARERALELCAEMVGADVRSQAAKDIDHTPTWYLHAQGLARAIRARKSLYE